MTSRAPEVRVVRVVATGTPEEEQRAWESVRRVLVQALQEAPQAKTSARSDQQG